MSTRIEDTRERLLAAARRLLVEHGYHGVGIEQIARECGFGSAALLRHHFRNLVGVTPRDYRRTFARTAGSTPR